MRFHRLVLLAAAPLALAALLGSAAPAGAAILGNSLSFNAILANGVNFNAIIGNALHSNALAATGAALGDLDGVAVEAVTLPDAAR